MQVAVYQFAPQFGNVKRNLKWIEQELENVSADLVVLPELCTTGYLFASREEVRSVAEPVPGGETIKRLEALCQWKGFHLVAGIAESAGDALFNSAVLVSPDGWIGTYRKIHLFWREKNWFTPGDKPFQVWNIGPARIGIMVCFDWMFPESARSLTLLGADILCHPANLVLPYGPDAMITRSLENRVYSITANRTGWEECGGKKLTFIGKSQVINPKGEILLRLGEEEKVKLIDIDPSIARNKKIIESNDVIEDRRPEFYITKSAIPQETPEAKKLRMKREVNPIFRPEAEEAPPKAAPSDTRRDQKKKEDANPIFHPDAADDF